MDGHDHGRNGHGHGDGRSRWWTVETVRNDQERSETKWNEVKQLVTGRSRFLLKTKDSLYRYWLLNKIKFKFFKKKNTALKRPIAFFDQVPIATFGSTYKINQINLVHFYIYLYFNTVVDSMCGRIMIPFEELFVKKVKRV